MLREKAIQLLKESIPIDSQYCIVDGQRVKIVEKDALLKEMLENKDYLKVPMPLYFSSPFWREVKVDSNTRCEKNSK